VALLGPLSDDQRATFLVVALPMKTLRKLVGQLGVAPRGTRLDALGEWELADALVDYYQDDVEVAAAVDLALQKELGASPLAGAVAAEGGAKALGDLVLAAKDPLRDLAWALLAHGPAEAGETAAGVAQAIIAEFDHADERARAEAEAEPASPPEPAPDVAVRAIAKEAAKARAARARALKRVGGMKDQVADLEERLAAARAELRAERALREESERLVERSREEARALRAQLAGGAAAEVDRLTDALVRAERRQHALEGELEEAREAEATLAARLRVREQERAGAPDASQEGAERAGGGATWSLPLFTDEFYDSIRRWDRKIVRTAFEKIHRLADDWRHPSLRAIPLEGLPGHFRIRIASDVRLIYRPLDGGRVEILSLIDREDLQRYIRTAKTRQSG